MKTLTQLSAAAALVMVAIPGGALAQFQVGGHVGFDFESSDVYIGPHVVFNLPVEISAYEYLKLNPEFSYYLADTDVPGVSSSFWWIGATALYPLGFEFASTYVGLGVILAHTSFSIDADPALEVALAQEIEDSSTDIGLNLKAGAEFGEGNARPFGEAGYVISDTGWFFLQGGARFQFGSD